MSFSQLCTDTATAVAAAKGEIISNFRLARVSNMSVICQYFTLESSTTKPVEIFSFQIHQQYFYEASRCTMMKSTKFTEVKLEKRTCTGQRWKLHLSNLMNSTKKAPKQ